MLHCGLLHITAHAGIAAVKTAMLGAALEAGVVSAEQLPALLANGANLHKVLQSETLRMSLAKPVQERQVGG